MPPAQCPKSTTDRGVKCAMPEIHHGSRREMRDAAGMASPCPYTKTRSLETAAVAVRRDILVDVLQRVFVGPILVEGIERGFAHRLRDGLVADLFLGNFAPGLTATVFDHGVVGT